jgi:hypothetical protein
MSLIWTNAALEPKRKFRYLIDFSGDATDASLTRSLQDFRFLAQTCDRPGVKVGASEHKYFDKTYYHPGRVTWEPNPLSIKLVDIAAKDQQTTDTNQALLKAFVKSGLQVFKNDNEFRTIGKDRAVGALGSVKISVLSSLTDATTLVEPTAFSQGQGVVEVWTLNNAWLESFKPDALDYGAEDILTVTIQVRYDWCTLETPTLPGSPLLR